MESNAKIRVPLWLFPCMIIMLLSGCSARKGVPYSQPLTLESKELKEGLVLFNEYCNSCHPGGSSGLGPAINNKALPQFLIRFQVRNGIGTMPAFRKVLTDEEVKSIAAYVVHLRKEG
ncbi:MAG: cytochrome c [Fulvivirga sp.]